MPVGKNRLGKSIDKRVIHDSHALPEISNPAQANSDPPPTKDGLDECLQCIDYAIRRR